MGAILAAYYVLWRKPNRKYPDFTFSPIKNEDTVFRHGERKPDKNSALASNRLSNIGEFSHQYVNIADFAIVTFFFRLLSCAGVSVRADDVTSRRRPSSLCGAKKLKKKRTCIAIDCGQHKAPLYSLAVIWSYITGLGSIGAKSKLLSLCSRVCVFGARVTVVFCFVRYRSAGCFLLPVFYRVANLPGQNASARRTLYFTPTSVYPTMDNRRTNAKTFVHFAHAVRRNNICIPIWLLLFFFLFIFYCNPNKIDPARTLFRRLGARIIAEPVIYTRVSLLSNTIAARIITRFIYGRGPVGSADGETRLKNCSATDDVDRVGRRYRPEARDNCFRMGNNLCKLHISCTETRRIIQKNFEERIYRSFCFYSGRQTVLRACGNRGLIWPKRPSSRGVRFVNE